jgi:DNA-binding transcriptional ArsR family regulator
MHVLVNNPVRRLVLETLLDRPDSLLVTELSAAVAETVGFEPRQLQTGLHHCHLPKLDAHDLVEYDVDDNVVRLEADRKRVENVLGAVKEIEATLESA